jgi:aminopeptidase N
MMDQFVVRYLQTVMRFDANYQVNPMTSNVYSPSEIDNNFNGIAYDKGESYIGSIDGMNRVDFSRKCH